MPNESSSPGVQQAEMMEARAKEKGELNDMPALPVDRIFQGTIATKPGPECRHKAPVPVCKVFKLVCPECNMRYKITDVPEAPPCCPDCQKAKAGER